MQNVISCGLVFGSRVAINLGIVLFIGLSFSCSGLLAKQTQLQTYQPPNAVNESTVFQLNQEMHKGVNYAPSPLATFEGVDNRPPYFSSTIPLNQLVTHKIDLRETLETIAKSRKCSMNEAFDVVARKLHLTPRDGAKPIASEPKTAIYRIVESDIYAITARQVFFNNLQTALYQLKFGDQQIVIDIKFVTLDADDVPVLQSFMIPETFRVFGNQLPQVIPATFAVEKKNEAEVINSGRSAEPKTQLQNATFVSATKSTTKALPTFVGQLDVAGQKQLTKFSRSRSSMEITQAPTVTLFPGNRGTLTDGSVRPFVVSVEQVDLGIKTGHRPVIQLVEDGTKLALRAEIKDGKIELVGDLAFSSIGEVKTFEYPFPGTEGEKLTIQVPEHEVRQVHWSTTIESGNALLIDPVEESESVVQAKSRLKKEITKKFRTLVLVSPTLVEKGE